MDHFASLGIQRQPWPDPAGVADQFRKLSSEWHPDRFQDGAEKKAAETRFAEINAANQCLRGTYSRLSHLLELEIGKAPHVQDVPPEAMDLFPRMAAFTRAVDQFLGESRGAESPMLRLAIMQQALEWSDKAQELQGVITEKIQGLEKELADLNPQWLEGNRDILPRLGRIAAALGFLERWRTQLDQKLGRLAGF